MINTPKTPTPAQIAKANANGRERYLARCEMLREQAQRKADEARTS